MRPGDHFGPLPPAIRRRPRLEQVLNNSTRREDCGDEGHTEAGLRSRVLEVAKERDPGPATFRAESAGETLRRATHGAAFSLA